MKSYGLDLQHADSNALADAIAFGTSFPQDLIKGSIFFLTEAFGSYAKGQYIFDGSVWLSGIGAIAPIFAPPVSSLSPLSINSEGLAPTFSRSDHTHSIVDFLPTKDYVDPVALAIIFGS